jgi:hypothetical protein
VTHPGSPPPRNPITHQAHRREVFRQITLPLLLGGLILLAAAVAVLVLGVRGQGDLRRWADTSLIWLIAPMMVFALLFLALTAGLVYAVTRLLGALPPFARQVQDIFILIRFRVAEMADKLVAPVLTTQERMASWRALRQSLRRAWPWRG